MGAALCCFGPLCCSYLCSFCGTSRKVYSRIGYLLFLLCWILISLILLHYGAKYFFFLRFFVNCPVSDITACYGISAVYRISFALVIFHLALFIICLFRSELSSAINDGAWPAKFGFIAIFVFASYFIPNSFFTFYGTLSVIMSLPFLIFIVLLWIDLAYSWNKSWTEQYSQSESNFWGIALIVTTALLYGFGLILMMWMVLNNFTFWTALEVLLTLLCGVVYTWLSMSSFVENGSLLTCGIVFLFNTFMCSSLIVKSSSSETFIGLLMMFVGLIYVSAFTQPSFQNNSGCGSQAAVKNIAGQVMEKGNQYENISAVSDDEGNSVPEITMATAYYHILMLFAAMYYAVLLTNWGTYQYKDQNTVSYLGISIKVMAQWLANAAFIWSLIAHRICPDRDFSFYMQRKE